MVTYIVRQTNGDCLNDEYEYLQELRKGKGTRQSEGIGLGNGYLLPCTGYFYFLNFCDPLHLTLDFLSALLLLEYFCQYIT